MRPDECDVADGTSTDCNFNDVPDECDVAAGTSPDADGSGIPDECEGCHGAADSNCDNLINVFDIDPFVVALTDRDAWEAQYFCDYICSNDCNGDGFVNSFDIDPFVELLIGRGR
jgi:hypothetical protein